MGKIVELKPLFLSAPFSTCNEFNLSLIPLLLILENKGIRVSRYVCISLLLRELIGIRVSTPQLFLPPNRDISSDLQTFINKNSFSLIF